MPAGRSRLSGSVWERPPGRSPPSGRHAALAAVPHGAKTYLAAALALDGTAGGTAERLCWIARDSEIGDRVAEELQAWLGDPEAVAVLEPRTALAYERSELVRDETAARVAAAGGVAVRPCPRPGRERGGAAATHPGPGGGAGSTGSPACRHPRSSGRAAPPAPRPRLRPGPRGRRPWRVRAPRRPRRHLPVGGTAPDPGRAVRRRDRLDARLRPNRSAQSPRRRGSGAAARQ